MSTSPFEDIARRLMLASALVATAQPVFAQTPTPSAIAPALAPASPYDPILAASLGANENGMRNYVLVILKSGPKRMPDGPDRKKMFEGHFANISRLAAERKLAVAGPTDNTDGWRGIFVFATGDIDEAKALVATDPVISSGEMVAEYHKLFASAGLMMTNEIHGRIQKK